MYVNICTHDASRCTCAEVTARRCESTHQQTCKSLLQQSHKRLHPGRNTPPSVLALVPCQSNPLVLHDLIPALRPLGRAAAGCPHPGLLADCAMSGLDRCMVGVACRYGWPSRWEPWCTRCSGSSITSSCTNSTKAASWVDCSRFCQTSAMPCSCNSRNCLSSFVIAKPMEADRQSIPAVLSEQAQSLLYSAAFSGSQVQNACHPMQLLSTHSRLHAS